MHFGMLAQLPLLVWLGIAATLVLPFFLPRFGMVIGVVGTIVGAVFCSNASNDEFARVIAHELGTAALMLSGLWLIVSCAGTIRGRVPAAAV